ncbi:MAG: hypothetical protein HFP77_06650 [Methylococcales symbiont of Iophon sp. n. MRB-2018]|nr:MAG: hypothetical protein HFP77_06650 [Methylococcales symbiont of Iophon sp. n. MRB-2018]KAF3979682.1 MAG: hypothetical protein HFP76_06020 [Methylococcales symbiont of Iophon sp. n. MRB-2018]
MPLKAPTVYLADTQHLVNIIAVEQPDVTDHNKRRLLDKVVKIARETAFSDIIEVPALNHLWILIQSDIPYLAW